jgi:hypothetical protein
MTTHYAQAESIVGSVNWHDETAVASLLEAVAHATLALAEQQRVANLAALALYQAADGSRPFQYLVTQPEGEDGVSLLPEIAAAVAGTDG